MGEIRRSIRKLPGASVFALALTVLPLRFDDPKHRGSELPLPLPGTSHDAEDPHLEIQRLFGKIEREMREIDALLAEASAGGAKTGDAQKKAAGAIAGITQLLEKSKEQGRSVVAEIDRILALADHPHPPGGS